MHTLSLSVTHTHSGNAKHSRARRRGPARSGQPAARAISTSNARANYWRAGRQERGKGKCRTAVHLQTSEREGNGGRGERGGGTRPPPTQILRTHTTTHAHSNGKKHARRDEAGGSGREKHGGIRREASETRAGGRGERDIQRQCRRRGATAPPPTHTPSPPRPRPLRCSAWCAASGASWRCSGWCCRCACGSTGEWAGSAWPPCSASSWCGGSCGRAWRVGGGRREPETKKKRDSTPLLFPIVASWRDGTTTHTLRARIRQEISVNTSAIGYTRSPGRGCECDEISNSQSFLPSPHHPLLYLVFFAGAPFFAREGAGRGGPGPTASPSPLLYQFSISRASIQASIAPLCLVWCVGTRVPRRTDCACVPGHTAPRHLFAEWATQCPHLLVSGLRVSINL